MLGTLSLTLSLKGEGTVLSGGRLSVHTEGPRGTNTPSPIGRGQG
jgi:hypothetical protein